MSTRAERFFAHKLQLTFIVKEDSKKCFLKALYQYEINQPPRTQLSRDEMNVIISQQAAENERSSRVSGIS